VISRRNFDNLILKECVKILKFKKTVVEYANIDVYNNNTIIILYICMHVWSLGKCWAYNLCHTHTIQLLKSYLLLQGFKFQNFI